MFQSVGEGDPSSGHARSRDAASRNNAERAVAAQDIRIVVAVDSITAPAWIARVLQSLDEAPHTRLAAVLHCPAAVTKKRRALSRRLYNAFDAPTLTRNAFAPVDLLSIAGEARIVKPPLRDGAVDIVVDLTGSAAKHISSTPRFGTWTVEIGDGSDDDTPGFREFAAQEPSTMARLVVRGGPFDGSIATTSTGTDTIHLLRSLNRIYWQIAALISEEVERLHRTGRVGDPARSREIARHDPRSPSHVLLSSATRKLRHAIRDRLMREQWFVAYGSPSSEPRTFQPLIPPRDRLWADPFVVANGDRAVVFVEEMLYRDKRGAIACFEIERNGTATQPRRVLERPYHLSYPAVFSWSGEYFMVPESVQNRTIELYRSTRFPFDWTLERVLMSDVAAVDSTIFEHDGLWWMYTTTSAHGMTYNTLTIYYSETPLGPWRAHPMNPLQRHPAGSRCAGRPFLRDGKWIRAAQNGCRRYGHSMELREIVTLTPDRWEERVVADIAPDWRRGLSGTHTFNVDGEFAVIDGLQYRWRS